MEKQQEKKTKPIHHITTANGRFHIDMEGHFMRVWRAVPENGTPYEKLFEPEFWGSVADRIGLGDTIRVEPEEGTYSAELRVRSIGPGGVKVEEFYRKDWETGESPDSLTEKYSVGWAGPVHKWRIVRKTDEHVLRHGFASESDAVLWLKENQKDL